MINHKIFFANDESNGRINPDRAFSEMLNRAEADAENETDTFDEHSDELEINNPKALR